MKRTRFVNQTRGVALAENALIADNFFLRMRGLLFRPALQPGEGLFLRGCNCIHMFGMSYAIDAVFIDQNDHVVGLVDSIKPGCLSPVFVRAKSCLELPAGTVKCTGTTLGDLVATEELSSAI